MWSQTPVTTIFTPHQHMQLFILLLAFTAIFSCEAGTLLSLLDEKYAPLYEECKANSFVGYLNDDDGKPYMVTIPRPYTFLQQDLVNEEVREILENFEVDSDEVYDDDRLVMFVCSDSVKSFNTSQISKDIVAHCLSVNARPDYLEKLLISSVRFGVEELSNYLFEQYHESLVDSLEDTFFKHDLAIAAAKSGSFMLIRNLIESEIISDEFFIFAEIFCRSAKIEHLAETLEFLHYLIAEKNDFQTIRGIPKLNSILRTRRGAQEAEFSELTSSFLRNFDYTESVLAN